MRGVRRGDWKRTGPEGPLAGPGHAAPPGSWSDSQPASSASSARPSSLSHMQAVFSPQRASRRQHGVRAIHESARRPPPALYLHDRRRHGRHGVGELVGERCEVVSGHEAIVAGASTRPDHPNGRPPNGRDESLMNLLASQGRSTSDFRLDGLVGRLPNKQPAAAIAMNKVFETSVSFVIMFVAPHTERPTQSSTLRRERTSARL